jgi:hypothetical protein
VWADQLAIAATDTFILRQTKDRSVIKISQTLHEGSPFFFVYIYGPAIQNIRANTAELI